MRRRTRDTGAGSQSPESGQVPSLDMARLDRDLRDISIEERCSFGPELRAELAAEYARLQASRPSRFRGARLAAMAAAIVILVMAGTWMVPPARAALARLLQSVPEAEPAAVEPLPEVTASVPEVVVEVEALPVLEDLDVEVDLSVPPRPSVGDIPDGPPPPPPPTLPSLIDRDLARRIVTEEYPVALQRGGVGGVVRVLLWVRPDGAPESPTLRVSSGIRELDEAALRATRSFRFLAATRAGQKVGTWVEFSIRFEPKVKGPQPDPEYQAPEIPLGN